MAFMLVPLVVILVFGFVALMVIKSCIYVVPPNQVLVLSGRPRRLPNGGVVGYRVVTGGRVIRIPILETAETMDLTNMTVTVKVKNYYTAKGVPVSFEAVGNVRINVDPKVLHNAIERFLGRSRSEIQTVAKEVLEGLLRQAAAEMTPQALERDRDAVAELVMRQGEFEKLGLKLDTLKVKNVRVSEQPPSVEQLEQAELALLLEDSEMEPSAGMPEPEIPGAQAVLEPDSRVPSVEPQGDLTRLAGGELSPSARDALIESYRDREVELVVTVDNVTFGSAVGLPQAYQGGQTVTGRTLGALAVAISFPKDRTDEVKALMRGAELACQVKLIRWDNLFNRLAAMAV